MKKYLFKLILFLGSIFVFVPSVMWSTHELRLDVPTPSWQWDLSKIIPSGSTRVHTDRTELVDIINIINKYLWFSLAWIAMAIFVYAWILLIAWWKKENFEKANKMLLAAGVAIVVSMLSYTIIKLILNLF